MTRCFALVAVLSLAACGDPTDDERAEDLWAAMDGYSSWNQTTDWTGVQPHTTGHGSASHVQIWLNDTANGAFGSTVPDGGIVVKETYAAADGEAQKIFAMEKIADYDADNGDWFYVRYSTDGTVDTAGEAAVGGCAGCHNDASDVDRVWSASVGPGTEE